ncbi:MAG: hypothetical protein HY236_08515 [Acidobacteria bacterium]|nr:hypothetical protein [Acidobacteriota bacterium]
MPARLKIWIVPAALVLLSALWIAPASEGRSLLPATPYSLYQGYLAGRDSGAWLFSMVEALGSQAASRQQAPDPSCPNPSS